MDPQSNQPYISNQNNPSNEVPLDKESDLIPGDSIHPINNQPNQELNLPSHSEIMNQHPLDSPIQNNNDVQYQAGNYNPNINQSQAPPVNNAQPVLVVGKQTEKVVYTGKPFPCCLAYTCFIINLFLPGIGTMIGVCGMNDKNMKIAYICSGCCQLVTFVCIVGWCYALCTSILYIMASGANEPFESYLASKKQKEEVQIQMVNIPQSNNNQVQQNALNEKAQNYAQL